MTTEPATKAPRWWHCGIHGPGNATAWGCPECVREMRAELKALRKDAERYRYLRNRVPRDVLERSGPDAGCWIDCEASSGPAALTLLTGDDADSAVDAAMDAT